MKTTHRTPPRCLADVEALATTAMAWATKHPDVFALAVIVGRLPPNDRPVLQLDVSYRVEGKLGFFREMVDPYMQSPKVWLRARLAFALRDAKKKARNEKGGGS